MQAPSGPATKVSWQLLAGAFVLLLVFTFVVIALQAIAPSGTTADAARAVERIEARKALEAGNKEKLETYAWVDRAKGSVQIPIERAMTLTVAKFKGAKPHAAGPIGVAPPAESATAAPAP